MSEMFERYGYGYGVEVRVLWMCGGKRVLKG